MPRTIAADCAAKVGAAVAASVTKKTTILVVGDQDLSKVGPEGKSSKQRKADELVAEGQAIRIIGETDFIALVEEC